ncbi:MAG: hypothetical protein ACFFCD_17135 [Promethearchaeota archaeon]
MAVITLPGVITLLVDILALDDLMRRFGSARKRASSMERQGVATPSIETILQKEIGLNSRYIKDAYCSIKHLPYNTTLGSLKNPAVTRER